MTEASQLKMKLKAIDIPNSEAGGEELASIFKKEYRSITGIVSLLDAATIGFVNSAKEFGLLIPRDLSIIGVNMLESQAESTHPTISTVTFDAYEMAKSCGKMMVESIEAGKNNKKKRTELWVGDFVDRGSATHIQ
jgi:DNA-binding LacI/PurR family transcriptional regulator